MERIALQRNSSSRNSDGKHTNISTKQILVDNRPKVGEITELKKKMQDATLQRKSAQLRWMSMCNSNVVAQFEWGDGDSPNDILQRLTGKGVGEFLNNRGEAFDIVEKHGSSQGLMLYLKKSGSETHVTIPFRINVDEEKYEVRDIVHITGLFNSGTSEAPTMTEWEATYSLEAGRMTTAPIRREGKGHTLVRTVSLESGKFVLKNKVAGGHRKPAARGEDGERKFVRSPSSTSLALTAPPHLIAE